MTGAVRLFDPDTSRIAAASISGRVEQAILRVFEAWGAELTDDELSNILKGHHPPTVKSARSRLTKAGFLRDTGKRRLSNRGQPMIVWAR